MEHTGALPHPSVAILVGDEVEVRDSCLDDTKRVEVDSEPEEDDVEDEIEGGIDRDEDDDSHRGDRSSKDEPKPESARVPAPLKNKKRKRENADIVLDLKAKLSDAKKKHAEAIKKQKESYEKKMEHAKKEFCKLRTDRNEARGKATGKHKLEQKYQKMQSEHEEMASKLRTVTWERNGLSLIRDDLRNALKDALRSMDHEVPDCELVGMVSKRLARLKQLSAETRSSLYG